MNYTNEVNTVIEFINKCRKEFPNLKDSDLEKNGAIFYMNGNDSTPFDWDINNRLCEFGIGVADGSVYAFKCHINKDGSAQCYCYPHGEQQPVKTIEKDLFDREEVNNLYSTMMEVADNQYLWDKTIEELFK